MPAAFAEMLSITTGMVVFLTILIKYEGVLWLLKQCDLWALKRASSHLAASDLPGTPVSIGTTQQPNILRILRYFAPIKHAAVVAIAGMNFSGMNCWMTWHRGRILSPPSRGVLTLQASISWIRMLVPFTRKSIFKSQLWVKSWFPRECWHLAEAHQKDTREPSRAPASSLPHPEECKLDPAKKEPTNQWWCM